MPQPNAAIVGLSISILSTALILPQRAFGEAAAGTESSDANSSQLEEVTVTAQRRAENIDKVPISMTAFSQKNLDDLHVVSVSDLASITPGVVIPAPSSTNNANPDIAIRGIFSGGNTPTTQIYIDETPIAIREIRQAGPSGTFFPAIFDVERVEVLRGPQGTLFGASAMGGAIRFITPQPNLHDTSGYAKVEFAATDGGGPSYAAGAAYGAPIVDGAVGFRVSSWYTSDGGYIDAVDPFTNQTVKHDANWSDSFANRAALTIVPTDGLTITPAVFIQHKHLADVPGVWITPDLGSHTSGDAASQPNADNVSIPSLSVKYELPTMVFQSDTSYLDRWYRTYDDTTQLFEALFGGCIRCAGIPDTFTIQQLQFGGTRAWQQEFRLTSSNTSRVQWVLGAYYRRARETLTQIVPDINPLTEGLYGQSSQQFFGTANYVLNGKSLTEFVDFNTVDEEKALFGNISVDIVSGLKASAGVRASRSLVDGQTQVLAGPFGGSALPTLLTLPDEKANPVTPRYSLTYQITDRDMVYATAAKGYRLGGANDVGSLISPMCPPILQELGISGLPLTFNSDSLWSYELGSKNALFDGHLSVQASVFYINWSNIQTQINQQGCGTFTTNRGKATVQGGELQFEAIPFEGVRLGGNVSYTDAYYPNAQYGVATGGGPVPVMNGAGDKLAQVLPWTAALHAEYSWSLGALWSGARSYARADYRWQDADPSGDSAVAAYDAIKNTYRDPAYSILNLRVGVIQQGLDVSLFVNNATRSDPRLSFTEYPGAPNYVLSYATAIRPLTAGITALYRF